jgi:Amt family ammonium transporter
VVNKGRFVPFLIFIVLWATFIYDPIARWSWYSGGWSHKWGSLDFAGGTVVHICAATTAATYSVFFRIRARFFRGRGFKTEEVELREHSQSPDPAREGQDERGASSRQKAHSIPNVVIGTVFLWVGWFGFNGGSALGANVRAVSACTSTFLAACAGGLAWNFFDWATITLVRAWRRSRQKKNGGSPQQRHVGKFSVVGFCNGVVAGLVAITPAAGYVSSPSGCFIRGHVDID